jgi:hypothetical protein
MEGSLVAYKVFTNGSVLQASEINDNLMRQSVMVFSNAAARSAALTVPLEGMITWLEDVNAHQYYNGSAWVALTTPTGISLVHTSTYTGQTSITINNVFSSTYDNYLIQMTHTQNTSNSDSVFTLANGGTPAASNWGFQSLRMYAAGLTSFTGTATNTGASSPAISVGAGQIQNISIELFSPFKTQQTACFINQMNAASGFGGNDSTMQKARLANSTSYEGFRFNTTAGTITGEISIYGYRKN